MIKRIFNRYIKNPAFRNIGYLTIGNILSQIISLIGALYIPNMLGPEKYGIYNTVFAYVSLFTVFTFSGLNKVVIRESSRNLENAKAIIEDTIGIRNLFSFLAILVCLFFVLFIDYGIGTKVYIAVYSISLLFTGIENSVNSIYQSFQKMRILAILSISKSIAMVTLTIFFLSSGYGIMTLIIVNLIISLIILIINIKFSRKILAFNILSKIKFSKSCIRSGFNFTILEFLGILSGKIDLVMISLLASPEKVGIYSLAYRIVEKGLLIRNPLSQSLFPYYSSKFKSKISIDIKVLYSHTFTILFPALFICLFAILFSKIFIISIVGIEYTESIFILNTLIFYLVFNYSVIPFGLFLQTIGEEQLSIKINVVTAILNILLNYILFNQFGLIGIAYSTLFVELCRLFLAIIYSDRVLKKAN